MIRILLLALIGTCVVHCTGKGSKTPADTLVVGLAAQPATLDPRLAMDANGIRIGGLIFNGLVRVGPNFEPLPDAAERWTNDGAKYVFFLKPDLKFHNGRALTPEDVDYTFQEFGKKGSPFASTLEGVKSLKASSEDGRVVIRLELKEPSEKFLVADLPIVRLLPKGEAPEKLIGTGGFKFVSQDLSEIRLESVSAKVKNLVFKIVRDDLTRFQKLQKGEIDLAQAELPADKVDQLSSENFNVYRYPGLTMTYILVNFKDKLLGRKEVREALAKSLERGEIIQHKLRGLGTEATSILTPNNPYFNGELKNPSPEVSAAAKIIESMGLKGQKLTLKSSNNPQAVDNAKVVANQMARTGLTVELQSYEWATFYDDVKKGNFQLATMKWVGTVDPDIYRMAFHSREVPPGRNRGSYKNQKLDKLMDDGANVPRERRKRIYDEVQKIVHEDYAIIPLWYDQQVAVASKRIEGYQPEPSSSFYPFLNVSKK